MRRALRAWSISASVIASAFLGCNSLLDNQPGVLVEPAASETLPELGAAPGTPETPVPTSDAGGAGDSASAACPTGQQICFGTCVSATDPLYGCGSPSCTPCPSTHSTMACQGRQCTVSGCDPGYANCNAKAADGCEVDLSSAATCGACNATCAAADPLCAPSGSSFQCTNGCKPGAPLACGAECVDPLNSSNHCGGCNVKCPVVANGTEACNAGICTFKCKGQFHACGGMCAARTDPATCGDDCAPCPVPAGGTATCLKDTCGMKCPAPSHLCGTKCVGVGPLDNDPLACGATCKVCPAVPNGAATCALGTCGLACGAGFGNCDAIAANGCEVTFAADPLNCGMCGRSCAGLPCVNGVCDPPLPP